MLCNDSLIAQSLHSPKCANLLATPKGCTPLWELTAASSGVILKWLLSTQLIGPGETVATD